MIEPGDLELWETTVRVVEDISNDIILCELPISLDSLSLFNSYTKELYPPTR